VLVDGGDQLVVGTNQNVEVRDVFLNAGQKIKVTAQPKAFGQLPQVFLMASDPNDSSTWVRGRGSAAASGLPTGQNQPATTPLFTAPRTGWYGIVLINKHPQVAGDYTMTVTIT
jgi:hypothetical protein